MASQRAKTAQHQERSDPRSLGAAPEPWHRRPKETIQAYEAFTTYLTLGPARSNARVAQTLGKSKQLIDRWSRRHEWQLRIAAYEEHFALRAVSDLEDQRIEVMREHAALAHLLLRKSRARIEKIVEAPPEKTGDPETDRLALEEWLASSPTIDQALRAADLAVKIGRLAVGIDGQYAPPSDAPGGLVENLSDEDLHRLEEILAKAES